jgi:hypothetical protein
MSETVSAALIALVGTFATAAATVAAAYARSANRRIGSNGHEPLADLLLRHLEDDERRFRELHDSLAIHHGYLTLLLRHVVGIGRDNER